MKIEVVPYRSEWRAVFEQEKKALLRLVGSSVAQIYHIGSTAVEGLAAKPIIDIMIEAHSLEELDLDTEKFESLGYEVLGEFGIRGRRYYRKGREERTHQIHAFQKSDSHLLRHLAFRDYLRAYPQVRKKYEDLKLRVLSQCDQDIDRYCEGKNEFIKTHERIALEWSRQGSDGESQD